jgi:hypothetical protein
MNSKIDKTIKKAYFPVSVRFFLLFQKMFNFIFIFLGLRKPRKFWGVVYDSVVKKPLDPVMVKLVSADGLQEVQNCITDISGRYGFLVEPGMYKILAQKTHYRFPSQLSSSQTDGFYEDLYRGELFNLVGESEVVAPNIPMDPINFDWNQEAKDSYIKKYPYLKNFVTQFISVIFWFLFLFSFAWILIVYLNRLTFTKFTYFMLSIFIVFLSLYLLEKIVNQPRLWGRLRVGGTLKPIAGALLELKNPSLPNLVLAKTVTRSDGKFFLRLNPGSYDIYVKLPVDSNLKSAGELRLGFQVGSEAVCNPTIYVV